MPWTGSINIYPYPYEDEKSLAWERFARVVRGDTDKQHFFFSKKKGKKKYSSTSSETMSFADLTIVAIQEKHFSDVINHLRLNFFADEPLNKAVGLCQPGDSHYELEQHCLQTLKQGYSRMLIDNKGTVCTCYMFSNFFLSNFSIFSLKKNCNYINNKEF